MAELPNVKIVVIPLIALAVLFMHAQVNNWHLLRSLKKLGAGDDDDPDFGYDQQCKSRAEYRSYLRKTALFKPSDNLRKRLHDYERLHASCVPAEKRTSCQFLMYVPPEYGCGIGNKIMGLVSTFALSLLTNRMLILPQVQNLDLLLCEPFRGSSWILPDNLSHLTAYDDSIRMGRFTNGWLPEVALAQLSNFANAADLEFFTQEQQKNIALQVRWLILETDQYIMPAFFHVPAFKGELQRLFPEQEAIFHLLVRYLLHPSNPVWGMTARFYDAYLRQADLLVAIQMRIHHPLRELRGDSFGPEYVHEVFQCLVEQEVLPNVTVTAASRPLPRYAARHISVLVASLDSGYFNVLRTKYVQNGAVDGSFVAVHQPSAEKSQQTGDLEHDKKAFMDILLLSMADVLVTSPISTFGYSAQGLSGTRPLQVACKRNNNSSQPICGRKASMEPCYHAYPADMVVDNVQLCECDFGFGLKAATQPPFS